MFVLYSVDDSFDSVSSGDVTLVGCSTSELVLQRKKYELQKNDQIHNEILDTFHRIKNKLDMSNPFYRSNLSNQTGEESAKKYGEWYLGNRQTAYDRTVETLGSSVSELFPTPESIVSTLPISVVYYVEEVEVFE
jgi:hypothetical protein